MKTFVPGALVTLNDKAKPLHEHKGWLVPGRNARIIEIDYENKNRRSRWYLVQLLGKSGNVIGRTRVPSNWLDSVE